MKEYMQEIKERMKPKIDPYQENQARMEVKMNSNQKKAEADRIADRECMKQMMARTEENRERGREDLKRMMAEMYAKMDGKQEEMLARMREDIKSGQAEMRSTICAFRSELDETTACQEATETEPDPRMMQSIEEHQEIPKEEAAVMLVGKSRKRRRVCNLAAERHQKRKERTRGNRGSRRKSALPAGRCPSVQKWHGVKGTTSEKFGSWRSLDGERSLPPPE
jgi:hypothetical protein